MLPEVCGSSMTQKGNLQTCQYDGHLMSQYTTIIFQG